MTAPITPDPTNGLAAAAAAVLPNGLSPTIISWIRTAVPMAVGVAITFGEHELARHNSWVPPVDTATVAQAVTGAVVIAYYTAVRQLEKWKPALGWLLGFPAQPQY